jgi:hypothetical protein
LTALQGLFKCTEWLPARPACGRQYKDFVKRIPAGNGQSVRQHQFRVIKWSTLQPHTRICQVLEEFHDIST